jgi:biopolymer transport protein ExbD
MNLVPFIDLLSCCIAFLLITAAWSQLSRIEGSVGGAGEGEARATPRVTVHKSGYSLSDKGSESQIADLRALDTALRALEAHEAIELGADDDVAHDRLIEAMDRARGAGFVQIALQTGS